MTMANIMRWSSRVSTTAQEAGAMYGPIVLCRLSRPIGGHGITNANNRGRLSWRPLKLEPAKVTPLLLHWPKVISFNPPTFWALTLAVVNVTRFRLDPSNKVTAARLKPKYFCVIPITFVSRPNLITRSVRARHRHPPFGSSKACGLAKLGHLKIVIRTKASKLGQYRGVGTGLF